MTYLPHDARTKIRNSIATINKQKLLLENCLYKRQKPDADMARILTDLTGTSSPTGQLQALTDVHGQMDKLYMDQLLEMAPNDLTAYAEYMNPEEPPAHHHIWLCEKLMQLESRDLMRMVVSMAPGHAKSVYCSRLFPSWYLGRNQKHKYLQGGHTQTFCENEFGKPTKALVDSEKFRDIFPDVKLAVDTKAAGTWALQSGGKYYTKGVGVGLSGFRTNCAGIDDPFALREDAESQTIRDKVYDWFSADFTTRLLPNSPMFLVMTRWHSDDLAGRIEEMNKKKKGLPWFIINLPVICDSLDDPLGRSIGDVLWPDFYTMETIMNLKATLTSRDWNSLYMGQPLDAVGGAIDITKFQRYSKLPEQSERKRTLVSVDTAMKDNQRADYTAIGVWIETFDGKYYLAHVHREKLEFDPMTKKINQIATQWGAHGILVEDKGSGTQFIQQNQTGKSIHPVIAISTNNNSKEFRMDGVTPTIEGGLVYIPEDAKWLSDYEKELAAFPFGVKDDMVDMTSQYLHYVRTKVGGKTAKVTGMQTSGRADNKKVKEAIGKQLAALTESREVHPIVAQLEALKLREQMQDVITRTS